MLITERTVYAVIPTYNRVKLTSQCVRRLLGQSYPRIIVIVSDGGSSDGTPEVIRAEFPSVTVLTTTKELWWGGAMARGIDWVRKQGVPESDYVLMMNDDTEFEPDLVECLVGASEEFDAAVAAATVDSIHPSVILDAGTYIDWEEYKFNVMTDFEEGRNGRYDVDVLPGRATLIPIHMIQAAGNVDASRFPHYISDYEFFYRLKRHGFRLGVTSETSIPSHVDMTGVFIRQGKRYGFREYLSILAGRRSMNNIFDHYRFIMRCGPKGRRAKIIGRAFGRVIINGIRRITRGEGRTTQR